MDIQKINLEVNPVHPLDRHCRETNQMPGPYRKEWTTDLRPSPGEECDDGKNLKDGGPNNS